MCGIVGHLGPQSSVSVVLEGLKRLEYRGYDSAGVCWIDALGKLNLVKKSGKIKNLTHELEGKDTSSSSSIGHTRWATHGKVTDFNSHPHQYKNIALVHNGIIENAQDLKEEIDSSTYQFSSETDSEVFLALLIQKTSQGMTLKEAVCDSFKKVKGFSAIAVLDSDSQDIYAIKNGAPLVCGTLQADGQVLVSSDPYALVGVADKIFFPEDNILCHLSAKKKELLNFFDLEGNPSQSFISQKQKMTLDSSDLGGFEHYMQKEIHEQPGLVRSLHQYYLFGDGKEALKELSGLRPRKIHIAACGTAYYAGLVIKDYLERFAKIPTEVELASEFRYRGPLIGKEDLGLFISQSGETADTLAAHELCQKSGLKTLSIVNVEGSTLFRNCDHNLLIRAGREIGVASTKAFTQMVSVGRLLALSLSGQLNDQKETESMKSKLNRLADEIENVFERMGDIEQIAEEVLNKKGFIFTGRGTCFPIALEGALKLKEIAYVHAEGYASGELKHGPLALIDENMVNLALVGPELLEKTISNIQEIKARKGIIVAFGPKNHAELKAISAYYFGLNFDGLGEFAPLLCNVVNQTFAYLLARRKGTDIDKPRNLAKSVTVE